MRGIIYEFVCVFFFLFGMLLTVAYLTLLERKLLASIQRRKGPNKVGIFGLLQPFADAVKVLLKEPVVPLMANF
jgi:NADH-quinone oxidoreductase subunit H